MDNNPRLENVLLHLGEAFQALANAASAIHDASCSGFDDSPAEIVQPSVLLTLLEQSRRPLREVAGIVSLIQRGEQSHVATFACMEGITRG